MGSGGFQTAILSAYSARVSVMVNTVDNTCGCGVNLPKGIKRTVVLTLKKKKKKVGKKNRNDKKQ